MLLFQESSVFDKALLSFSCIRPQVKAYSIQNEGTQIQIRVYSKTKCHVSISVAYEGSSFFAYNAASKFKVQEALLPASGL